MKQNLQDEKGWWLLLRKYFKYLPVKCTKKDCLKQSFISERIITFQCYNKVVQYLHVK